MGSPGENLLGLIPGLQLRHIESGCSGMAGTFGLLHQNYRTSLRAGWKLISRLRDPALHAGATECSTCKMQMEQGTTKPTIHPIKLLALSYGLMPEIARLLTSPRRGVDRIVSEPWFREGLKFACTGCGDCCTGEPGYVWVNKAEIEAMAAAVATQRSRSSNAATCA